jgi:hypothetical protein
MIFLTLDKYYKIIEEGVEDWLPQPRGFYSKIFNKLVVDEGNAFEIDINEIKKDRPRSSIDSVVSAFYSWKKKKAIQELLNTRNLDIKIIKRGNKVGIVKIYKTGQDKC